MPAQASSPQGVAQRSGETRRTCLEDVAMRVDQRLFRQPRMKSSAFGKEHGHGISERR